MSILNFRKWLPLMILFLLTSSCEDKKNYKYGTINLRFDYEATVQQSSINTNASQNSKEISNNPVKTVQFKEELPLKNGKTLDSNTQPNKIIESPQSLNEIFSKVLQDYSTARITINNGTPTSINLATTTSYNRAVSIGTAQVKVELMNGSSVLYQSIKSVQVLEDQSSTVNFTPDDWTVENQEISITNGGFDSEVNIGESITFNWTNTHAARPVSVQLIQSNENNVISTFDNNFVGLSYTFNTNGATPANNLGFKIVSNIQNTTSASICCFDLVAANSTPVVNNVSDSTDEDNAVEIQFDGSDSDGDSLTYSIVAAPSNGSLGSINNDKVTYTPNQNYNGTDTFTYKANDGSSDSNVATVSITINPVNDAPVANSFSVSTPSGTPLQFALQVSDVDGDDLIASITSNVSNGNLAFVGTNTMYYNPNTGFSGTDSFNYVVNDGTVNSPVATVTINVVGSTPVVSNVSDSTDEDNAVEIQFDGSDGDGDSLTYSIVAAPSNGSLGSINNDKVTYTPNQNYNGTDTFTYKANDGSSDSNVATVSITINPVNDAPVANSFSVSTPSGTPLQFALQVSDVDGDDLQSSITSNVSNGSLSFAGANTVNYNPNTGFSGTDSFNYIVNDGTVNSPVATVTINVNASTNFTFPGGGEELVCGRTYILRWEDGFSNNAIELYQGNQKIQTISGDAGNVSKFEWTVNCNSIGSNFYINIYDAGPGQEEFKSNSFEIISDPKDLYTPIETLTYSYRSSSPSVTSTTFSSNKQYYMQASGTVYYSDQNLMDAAYRIRNLRVDYDIPIPYDDDQVWKWNGEIPPRPDGDYYNSTHIYDYYFTGTDEKISVLFSDSGYGDNGGTLTFNFFEVSDSNRPPTTNDVSTTIDENRVVQGRLVGITLDGSDPDGDEITYSLVTNPENGTATLSGNTVTYTANQDWNGVETFTYKANDGELDSNTSTITVTVNPVNDTPVVIGGVDDTTTDSSLDVTNGRAWGSIDFDYSSFDVNTSNPGSASSPATEHGLANHTISIWAYFDSFSGTQYLYSDSNEDAGYGFGYSSNGGEYTNQIQMNGNTLTYNFLGKDGSLETISANTNFSTNEWYHIVVVNEHGVQGRTGVEQPGGSTSENNGHRLYINGQFIASARHSGSQMLNDTGFYITEDATPTSSPVDRGQSAYVDGFALWDDYLPSDAISKITALGRNHDLRINSGDYTSSADLKAFYSFDSETNNVVTDLTGNGQDLTLKDNATIIGFNTPDINDYSALFESSNRSYLKLPEIDSDLGTTNSSATFSVWFKPTADPDNTVLMHSTVSAGSGGYQGIFGRLGFTSGRMKVYHRNGIDDQEPSGTTDFSDSRDWNHFVYVIDGTSGELRGYANGNLEFTRSYDSSSSYYNSSRNWEIGDISFGASYHSFKGYMDDVAIWDIALTSDQIALLYNDGNMVAAKNIAATNLKAYYDFEDNSVNDKSGNGKHPTQQAFVSVGNDDGAGYGGANFVTTNVNTAVNIDLSNYASDVDGDDLTYSIVTNVTNGTTALSGSTVTYTPNTNYSGIDSFTWKVYDGTVYSVLSTVSINVDGTNYLDNVQYSNNTWGSASDMVIVSWDKLRLDWNYSHDSSSRYDISMCNSSGNNCVEFETNVAATGSTSTGAYFSNLQVDMDSYISDEYPYEDARWQVCVSGTDNCGLSPTFDNYYKLIYPFSSGSVPSVSAGESIYMGLLGSQVSNLNISMSGGTGDADLYLYSVSNPFSSSATTNQVAISNGTTNSESISYASQGYYILGVYGYASASGYALTVSYNNKDGERVVQNFNSEDLGFSNQNDNPSFQKLNFDSELFKKEVIIK